MNKFLKVLGVTALEFGLLFWLFSWQNKLYHPTYVSFGVLLFVFWLGLNGALYEWHLNRKKGYKFVYGDETLTYYEGKNQLTLEDKEFISEKEGPYSVLTLPSETQWRQMMPDWATEHRTRIIRNIKAELGSEEWRYFDAETDKFDVEEEQ